VAEREVNILTRMAATAHDLALRYLLELSADIRGALLMDRDGALLASAGQLPHDGLAETGRHIAGEMTALAADGEGPVEVDVFASRGAMFALAENARVMVCTTNRAVNPGLIFYDMHAVLRDIDRAAAAEGRREAAGSGG
jgi:predicted regulator of Ras-like GTPase activity (Roadblock/LC7/MglB family)